jgi:hypothetical protein
MIVINFLQAVDAYVVRMEDALQHAQVLYRLGPLCSGHALSTMYTICLS